ncbi:helix-hairpin-helix domain-containing protein [Bacillus sp. AK031]
MLRSMFNKYKAPIAILMTAVFFIAVYIIRPDEQKNVVVEEGVQVESVDTPAAIVMNDEGNTEQKVANEIFVDVKGAVKKPGIYKAVMGERVNDLIIRAGGFTQDAGEDSVNLAQKVVDEMVVYVPEEGEEGAAAVPSITDTQGEAVLDINAAEKEDFEKLPGIGPSKAEAIIVYRTENGPFKTIDELKEVSGIGDGTFAKLKDSVTVR